MLKIFKKRDFCFDIKIITLKIKKKNTCSKQFEQKQFFFVLSSQFCITQKKFF